MKAFRLLRADEIEVRPQQIKDGKATMLLYIDSRSVVTLLNEEVGAENWQMELQEVNGQMVGRLGIWDETKSMWIWKSDTGSESNIEREKGLVSDIYKRCLSRWFTTELYSAPKIVIPDDGYKCSGYRVSEIAYNDNREITHLVIVNRFGKEAFSWYKDNNTPKPQPQVRTQAIESDNAGILKGFCTKMKTQEGVDLGSLKRFFDYFLPKMSDWKGQFNAEAMWQRWITPKPRVA